MALCMKCGDHHDSEECPPIWEACKLIDCKACQNNEHFVPWDVVAFGLLNSDRIFCGQCRASNSFYVKEWTEEAKQRHSVVSKGTDRQ